MWGVSLAVALIVGFCAAPASSATRCGSFLVDRGELRATVYKTAGLTCRTATRIVKEFRLYKRSRGSQEPYRLPRYPGWRCYEGSGGGNCAKGKQVASWGLGPPR